MAYDTDSDRVILFGGFLPGGAETWAYDYETNVWTNMTPTIQPTAWAMVDMVYDTESDRVVLFGGITVPSFNPLPTEISGETWTYDFNSNTWTEMRPSFAPSPRYRLGMAYDGESDRVVLFGGYLTPESQSNETWAYDLNSNNWTRMDPPTVPSRRGFHSMAYDTGADRVVLFGAFPLIGGTWAYDLNEDSWTQTNILSGPSTRRAAALAYDAGSDRTVLFGGDKGITASGDTWSHGFVFPPSPIPWEVYVAVGIVVGIVVAGAVVAVILMRRRKARQGGGAQE